MKTIIITTLFLVLCILLSGCSSNKLGYVYENGTWNYARLTKFAFGKRYLTPLDVDKDSFNVMEDKDFARDKEHVYYRAAVVENAVPDSFKVISTDSPYYRYAIDGEHVFLFTDDGDGIYQLHNADSDSFEAIRWPYSKDKNDAYCGSLPLFVDDITTFSVTEGSKSVARGIKSTVFLNGSVGMLADAAPYNRERYGFVTEYPALLYTEDGRASTDTTDYYGYIAVDCSSFVG